MWTMNRSTVSGPTPAERQQGQLPDDVLLAACRKGDSECVKGCLQSLSKIQKNNLDGALLGLAISCGHCEIVSLLLSAGIRRTNLAENGDTDILLAIRYKRQDILQLLLSLESDNLDKTNRFGVFPLLLAVKLKQVNTLKQLVLAGADVNTTIKTNRVNFEVTSYLAEDSAAEVDDVCEFASPSMGDTTLLILLRQLGFRMLYNDLSDYFTFDCMFDILIETEIDFTFLDINGYSLLDKAIISLCGIRILEKLIEKGCCISLPNPYHYACFEDSTERLEVIQRLGFDVNAPAANSPFCPLVVACMDQNVKVVNWFLDKGADSNAYVDARDVCSWLATLNRLPDVQAYGPLCKMTPLHFSLMGTMSIFMSARPILETLFRHGAEVNAQAANGQTPLFYLTRDLLGDDNFPIMPAYFKCCGPEESIFISLIKAGSDPDIATASGNVPLTFCVPEKLSRIALMFLDVSTNALKHISVMEKNSKLLHISDLTFLPIPKESLKSIIQNPRRLNMLCRKAILKACGGRHVNNESCFQSLPQRVQNYVQMKYLGDPEWYQHPFTLV